MAFREIEKCDKDIPMKMFIDYVLSNTLFYLLFLMNIVVLFGLKE